MKKIAHFPGFVLLILLAAALQPAQATLVNYHGNNGLSATADFSLLNGGNTLQIVVTNDSLTPFGGGAANQVLSSINFDMNGVQITGGSAHLAAGSAVVTQNGGAWVPAGGNPDLNDQYGYSNHGIGNGGGTLPSPYPNDLNAVTSHSNGGNGVTTFNGGSGVPGGLDYGILADGSSVFGNNKNYLQASVILDLTLNQALGNLDFLGNGSYVEFGSDYAYVTGERDAGSNTPAIPEPATLSLLGIGLGLGSLVTRRRKTRKG